MSEEYGLAERILTSAQYDRWRFMLSAQKLCRQDVAVISHSHIDAWSANLPQKDVVVIPAGLRVPENHRGLRNILQVEYSARIDGLSLTPIYRSTVERLTTLRIPKKLHAVWWHIKGTSGPEEANIIFLGDMDVSEGKYLLSFVGRLLELNRAVQGVILPSYGGVKYAHGAESLPQQLAQEVERTALELRDLYGLHLFAAPHPLPEPAWAELSAVEVSNNV